jgi:pimeloyl-ACP methyl ester carboxylesterase
MELEMNHVISKDGTRIAYETMGHGPALILVDGAFCFRGFGPMPGLAPLLTNHFTVYLYDRRGRGESGDTQPYALEREVEDIDALVDQAGGSAYIYGISSGAALALEAAYRLDGKVKKMALYEPPYNDDESLRPASRQYTKDLTALLSAGRNGDAAELFMRMVGMPEEQLAGMRQSPVWPVFEAVAPTLLYDDTALGKDRVVPVDRAASLKIPALVMNGGAGLPFMQTTASKLAGAIPGASYRSLEGQTHEVAADVLAPVLIDFFNA